MYLEQGDPRDEPLAWQVHNIEAEQALLGCILVNNEAHRLASNHVTHEHFYEPLHRSIFGAMTQLIEAGKIVDFKLLKSFIPNELVAPEMTVSQYLARLAAEATTIINAPDYARIIRELADRRRLAEIGNALQPVDASHPVGLATEAISALDEIIAANTAETGAPSLTMPQAVVRAVDAAAKAYQMDGRVIGIPTTFRDLDEKLGGMSEGDFVVLAGRPGMGKAMPMQTPVLTPKGWRAIGSLKVGDLVLNQDGRPVKIVAVHPQGVKEIFEVGFSDGRTARACGDHLWEVRSKHWRSSRVISTREICYRLDLVRYKKWMHVPLYAGDGMRSVRLPIPAYTLGAWLGDGSRGCGRITGIDPDIFKRIEKDGFRVGPPCFLARTIYGLGSKLKKLGVIDSNSWNRSIPPRYFSGSKSQRLELIRGLLDTDGTVEPSGTVRFCTASLPLAKGLQTLIWSVGGLCKISLKRTKRRDAYILSIRHPSAHKLFTLKRKIARLPKRYQYDRLGLRIDSISPAGEEDCVCITIDDQRGLYVAENYIVTHNSACILTLLRRAAAKGYISKFVSLEMGDISLMHRLISDQIYDMGGDRLPYANIRNGRFHEKMFERITEAGRMLAELPIHIEQQPGLTMSQISARARQMKRKGGLHILAIDHLDLIKPTGRYQGNKVYELGEITAAGKALAKELGIVVIMLAQLSREVEKREDKRPVLSDLRSSGSIEQDADTVIFLYRKSYYLAMNEPTPGTEDHAKWQVECEKHHNMLQAIVAKQRMGPTGPVDLFCDIANNAVRDLEGAR